MIRSYTGYSPAASQRNVLIRNGIFPYNHEHQNKIMTSQMPTFEIICEKIISPEFIIIFENIINGFCFGVVGIAQKTDISDSSNVR